MWTLSLLSIACQIVWSAAIPAPVHEGTESTIQNLPTGVTSAPHTPALGRRDILPQEQALVVFFTEYYWGGNGTYAGNNTHPEDCVKAPDNTSSFNIIDQETFSKEWFCTFASDDDCNSSGQNSFFNTTYSEESLEDTEWDKTIRSFSCKSQDRPPIETPPKTMPRVGTSSHHYARATNDTLLRLYSEANFTGNPTDSGTVGTLGACMSIPDGVQSVKLITHTSPAGGQLKCILYGTADCEFDDLEDDSLFISDDVPDLSLYSEDVAFHSHRCYFIRDW